jgi:hypothetical protein
LAAPIVKTALTTPGGGGARSAPGKIPFRSRAYLLDIWFGRVLFES